MCLKLFFYYFFSIFDLKIHRFLYQIWMHFAITPKTVKVNKTLRGRTNFEGRLLKNNIKIVTKSLQNEGAQKASQKPLQKSILGRILASKTHSKSKKNRIKVDVNKRLEKKSKKSTNETLLARNGKLEDVLEL